MSIVYLECREEFGRIMKAWMHDASMNDMFHKILYWIQEHRPHEFVPAIAEPIQDWLHRAEAGEDTNDLVEEFLFEKQYTDVHAYFECKKF
jgi:hypothetical protein